MMRRERGSFNDLNPTRNPLTHAPLNLAQIRHLHEFFFNLSGEMEFFCYDHSMEYASISRSTVASLVKAQKAKVPGVQRNLEVDQRVKPTRPHNKTPLETVRLIKRWATMNSQEVPDEFKIRRFTPPCVSKRATFRTFRAENPAIEIGRTCFNDIIHRCCYHIKVSSSQFSQFNHVSTD